MKSKIIIVCGVSGCGKSTVGKLLAAKLSIPFFDGDDYHPQSNINKMSSGQALNDEDRRSWLETLSKLLQSQESNTGAILACSALKEKYREILSNQLSLHVNWIFLKGSFDLLSERLTNRANHFFNPELLQSQFEALEIPKYGLHISITKDLNTIINEILVPMEKTKSEFGLIGLGVMGKSLAVNMLNNNTHLAVYNRHISGVEENIASLFQQEHTKYPHLEGFDELEGFIDSLETPKRIMLMVSAGPAVDVVIESLIPYLDQNDVIIDGGNSHYNDTKRRVELLNKKGIHFVGCGVSGGEEGALKGPSIMPGGSRIGYSQVEDVLMSIAAKDEKGNPCCSYIGPEGAGHFVKMIHNGIEYAEMQLIAETYHQLRFIGGLSVAEIADLFDTWNQGELKSYLLEISSKILTVKEGEGYLIDFILDVAEQKGTGGWSTTAALDLGVPLSTISESVMARHLSGMKNQREQAHTLYNKVKRSDTNTSKEQLITKLKSAYRSARIINHAIGLDVIQKMSRDRAWNVDISELTRVWTNGCIIRSELMTDLIDTYKTDPSSHLLLNINIIDKVTSDIPSLIEVVSLALTNGNSIPVFSAALNYFNGFTSRQLSTNMIQAQRDFFGAHTYKRNDSDTNQVFHTDWLNNIS